MSARLNSLLESNCQMKEETGTDRVPLTCCPLYCPSAKHYQGVKGTYQVIDVDQMCIPPNLC